MASRHHAADLQQAIESRVPYDQLSPPLRRMTPQEYQRLTVQFAVLRYRSYNRLPEFVQSNITEENYYETMISYLREKLQLYPYALIRKIVQYTRETPLSYYTVMIADLLRSERSYDTLPNFTAVDVLNLLGIGRNQYLELTKEVRSKLLWHINRSYVKDHLPNAMLPSVTIGPFWSVFLVEASHETIRRAGLNAEENALYRSFLRQSRGSIGNAGAVLRGNGNSSASSSAERSISLTEESLACELPRDALYRLYRKGLLCATFSVSAEDQIVVPPLERFVMNRTSDDPQEVLLYKILATIDGRTSLNLLAQLLMLDDEDVCAAAHVYIRLGLAHPRTIRIPAELNWTVDRVHPSWKDTVEAIAPDLGCGSFASNHNNMNKTISNANVSGSSVVTSHLVLEGEMMDGGDENSASHGQTFAFLNHNLSVDMSDTGGGHPVKRIALLYDASLTGFLMMTNLSADPTFKQHAVTLFELGKLSEEMIGSFIANLDQVDTAAEHQLGGEAAKYIHSVLCLREVLKELRGIIGPDGACGVDMLKVEAMNELEPTTRYSVLGRNYWSYFVTSPVSYAPLIDVALNGVYGSTVSLMPSPWMTLFLYDRMGVGAPSTLLPVGARLIAWPPALRETSRTVARLRLQPLTMDAEITYVDAATSVILANEMTATAPLFVQRVAEVPLEKTAPNDFLTEAVGFFSIPVVVPFTASDEEAMTLLREEIAHHRRMNAATDVRFTEQLNVSGSNKNHDCTESMDTVPRKFMECIQAAVRSLDLWDSVGSLTLYVSLREISVGTSPSFRLESAYVIDIGLGIPLTNRRCCSILVRHLADLLSESRAERHNEAMRRLAADFGDFLERHSPLTSSAREKMPLQSTAVTGPTTQLHIRRLGEGGNGGAPFPNAIISFDGEKLYTTDDCNPLVSMWGT